MSTAKFRTALLALAAMLMALSCGRGTDYPRVQDGCFLVDGKPEHYVGTNLWYAGRLASSEAGLARLRAELDTLCSIGIDNLRVLAVEGEDLDALGLALDEMAARKMYAVLYLNNAWEWSHGYRNYLEMAGEGPQPLPQEDGYNAYIKAMAEFSMNKQAISLNHQYIRKIVGRFRNHPAIFSWQLCNEPRCFTSDSTHMDAFVDYIHSTAALIKSIDHDHMVSTGSEGIIGCEINEELCRRINDCADIDYITVHIWPFNWSWIGRERVVEDLENAIAETDAYIDDHIRLSDELGKPFVIEEFGYPRDGLLFAKDTPVTARDSYYAHVFERLAQSAQQGGMLVGCNFWGWGGMARQNPDSIWWQEGDDFCGDPGQEQQGLNSVYLSDCSTVEIIRTANQKLTEIDGRRQ